MRGRSSSKEREKKKQRRGEVRERAAAEFGGKRKVLKILEELYFLKYAELLKGNNLWLY